MVNSYLLVRVVLYIFVLFRFVSVVSPFCCLRFKFHVIFKSLCKYKPVHGLVLLKGVLGMIFSFRGEGGILGTYFRGIYQNVMEHIKSLISKLQRYAVS